MVQDFVHQQYVNINKYYILCIRVGTPPGSPWPHTLACKLKYIYINNQIYACNVDMSIIIFLVNIDHEIVCIYIDVYTTMHNT